MFPDPLVPTRYFERGGSPKRPLGAICLLLAALVAGGCESKEGIVTYKIPKKIPEQLLPGKDRLLAVMVPRGEKVWFFKIDGPQKAVDLVDEDFRKFVSAIEFDEAGNPVLDALPENWRRGGKKPMRFATIDINVDAVQRQLELKVSNLATRGEMDDAAWDDYVVQNVDRWRGQVGLDPSKDKWAGGKPIDVPSALGKSVWVDLIGQPGQKNTGSMGMMGASGGMSGAPFANAGPPPGAAPPPVQRTSPPRSSRLKFEAPEGWQVGKSGGMREAAFSVGPAEATAEITIITAGGDLRNNVARWMRQVAGEQPGDEAVDKMLSDAEKFEVSGRPAQRFVIAGDQEKGQNSIDATIVSLEGGQSKFIKMTGSPETVAGQFEQVRTFLDSLSF